MDRLTDEEIKIISQALFDLAEGQDINHREAEVILGKIKSNNQLTK